jgi:predicted enzyme related to lactoylglutathione lyase
MRWVVSMLALRPSHQYFDNSIRPDGHCQLYVTIMSVNTASRLPAKGTDMSNPFVHLELSTSDVAKAKDFYTAMFGWTYQDSPSAAGTYSTFKPSSGPGGGMFSMPGMPTFWLTYIGVDDIQVSTNKAKSLGATIHKGPMEIPGVGWTTILADPTGATIALFQPIAA